MAPAFELRCPFGENSHTRYITGSMVRSFIFFVVAKIACFYPREDRGKEETKEKKTYRSRGYGVRLVAVVGLRCFSSLLTIIAHQFPRL